MITPELLDFIEAELKAGQHTDALFRLLREGGGWTTADVEEALAALEKKKNPVSVAEMLAHQDGVTNKGQTPVPRTTPPPSSPSMPQIAPVTLKVPPPSVAPTPEKQEETKKVAPPTPSVIIHSPVAPAPSRPVTEVSIEESWKHDAPPPQPTPSVRVHTPAQVGEMLRMPGLPKPVVTDQEIHVTERITIPIPQSPTPVIQTAPALNAPIETTTIGTSLRAPTSSVKKVGVILGAITILVLLGVGGFFLVKGMAPKAEKVFATMYASIPGIQSLRYNGETTLNFSGSVTDPLKAGFPSGYTGSAKVALKYDGRADLTKGIDGVHQFGITADLRSGESALTVNSSVELRIIGDTYYIKVSNPPEIKDIDLSRLNTYWLAVSPSDIVERFGGSLTGSADAYGSFGGASTTRTLRGFISSNPPFDALSRVGEEQVAGATTIHYRFSGNPDNLLAILRFIVNEVTGSPWEMTAEEEVNVKSLLKGVVGDIWIDPVTYLPRKIVFRQPLKGTVSGISVDGTLDVEQGYSEYNGPVSVPAPRPVITYDEFADDVKRQAARARATGDVRRVFDAGDIVALLEVYRANNDDRYPLTLDELVTSGLVPAIPTDPDGGSYRYVPYTAEGKIGKSFVCSISSPTCKFFHLGITLASPTDPVLKEDSDLVSEVISGADTKGCAKEEGKACYDLTPKSR